MYYTGPAFLAFARYGKTNIIAIQVLAEDPELERAITPLIKATINPDTPFPDPTMVNTHTVIKNWRENDGILESLIEQGVLKEPIGYMRCGFECGDVCEFTESWVEKAKGKEEIEE